MYIYWVHELCFSYMRRWASDLVVRRWGWVRHSTCKRKWGACECECVPCLYVCDMTHIDVYVCVIWLIQTFMCVWYDSYRRVCVCDMTHTDVYVCVIWLIQTCMCVWYDWYIRMTRSLVYDYSRNIGARDMNTSRTRAVIHTYDTTSYTHVTKSYTHMCVWLSYMTRRLGDKRRSCHVTMSYTEVDVIHWSRCHTLMSCTKV